MNCVQLFTIVGTIRTRFYVWCFFFFKESENIMDKFFAATLKKMINRGAFVMKVWLCVLLR